MIGALSQVATKLLSTTPYLQWGEPGAVVARSGDDAVTIENYNRRTGDTAALEEAVENDYKELQGIQSHFKMGITNRTANYVAQQNESRYARLKRLGKNYRSTPSWSTGRSRALSAIN